MARKKLRNTRPKALFGIGETGALIALTAAEVAGHAGQAAAQYAAAKSQGESILKQAQMQADAMKQQNENNNRLQTEMMQFTKEQNDESRQIMKDMQMNLQLQAGGLNTRDRREASKTIVKYGGRKKRKLRDAQYPLQGGNSFRTTDGGSAVPLGIDDSGMPVGIFVGPKHYQKHKTPSGTIEGGVGAELINNDGTPIPNGKFEAEGGEAYKETPFGVNVLSAHTRHGFNPTQAFMAGMPFDEAHAIQEYYKAIDGIDSEGKKISPVKRKRAALGLTLPNNVHNTLKNGGSVKKQIVSLNNRRKFAGGGQWWLSPTISGIGNIAGAGLSALGIGFGSNYLSDRVSKAGDILANAYGQLKGVDFSSVFGDKGSAEFSRGLYMPAVRSSYYSADPWLEEVHRNTRLAQRATKNNTNSSSAQLNRIASTNANEGVETSKIYSTKQNWEEEIKQKNNQAINEAGQANAQLIMQYLKDYTAQKADLAKFNANIENEKILGAAETRANTLQQLGQIGANKRQGIAGAFGSALAQTGLGFANAYNDKLTRDFELDLAKLGATQEGLTSWYANSNYVSDEQAYAYAQRLLNSAKLSSGEAREKAIQSANFILSSRGYPIVDQNLRKPNLRNVHLGYNFNLPTGLRGVGLN